MISDKDWLMNCVPGMNPGERALTPEEYKKELYKVMLDDEEEESSGGISRETTSPYSWQITDLRQSNTRSNFSGATTRCSAKGSI